MPTQQTSIIAIMANMPIVVASCTSGAGLLFWFIDYYFLSYYW